MKPFLGILKYEYKMSISRLSLLIITGLFSVAFILIGIQYSDVISEEPTDWLAEVAALTFQMNIFFPVIVGIITADRAVRDYNLNVRELLRVTKLNNTKYTLGKYLGVSLSILTMQLVIVTAFLSATVIYNQLNPLIVLQGLYASLLINGPMIFFITAFSLACPLFMPVRVYQILFTGYWYWGNFLNPEFFPTIANTYLNASGKYALVGFFSSSYAFTIGEASKLDAVINILVLFAMAGVALFTMSKLLTLRDRKA